MTLVAEVLAAGNDAAFDEMALEQEGAAQGVHVFRPAGPDDYADFSDWENEQMKKWSHRSGMEGVIIISQCFCGTLFKQLRYWNMDMGVLTVRLQGTLVHVVLL